MHPEFVSILDEVGGREFRFGIYTNGQRLTDEIADAIIRNASSNRKGNPPSYVSFNVTAMLDEKNTERKSDKDELRREQLEKIQRFAQRKLQRSCPVVVNASLLALPGSIGYSQIVRDLDDACVDNIRLSFPWLPQTDPRKRVLGGLKQDEFEDRTRTFTQLRHKYPEKVSVRLPSNLCSAHLDVIFSEYPSRGK
ncbi:MAG: hypothetical protein GY854_10610, partial [Deltaproteobacteria bacterium]|nr:hypothetical protein [Deltaproteobacteria bacterium]